jgi:hypothetical protein
MAKIGNLISSLKIDKKVLKNPEWWNTKHKLKKEISPYAGINASARFNTSYYVSGSKDFDTFEKRHDKLPEYASWNPIFRSGKTIITFSKEK